MSGNVKCRRIYLGKEATAGTAVVATAAWRGLGVLEDLIDIRFPDENVGIGPGTDRTYKAGVGAKLSLAPIEETFEQGPYLFEGGCLKLAAPTADGGGGSGKIYEYPFWYLPTSKPTVRPYTIEAGDDIKKEEAEYCHMTSIILSGKGKDPWMMSGEVAGRQVTLGPTLTGTTIAFVSATKKITDSGAGLAGFLTGTTIKVSGSTSNDGVYTVATGGVAGEIVVTETLVDEAASATITLEDWFTGGPTGLTLPTVEELLFNKTSLYLDAAGGTLGSTQATNVLLEATVRFDTGVVAQNTGSGNIAFSHLEYVPPVITAELTFLFNAAKAKTEEQNWKTQVARLMRLRTLGSALGTAGSVYTYKTRDIDLAGKWQKFDPMGDQNGLEIIKGTFLAKYDSTAAKFATVRYVNQLASLP